MSPVAADCAAPTGSALGGLGSSVEVHPREMLASSSAAAIAPLPFKIDVRSLPISIGLPLCDAVWSNRWVRSYRTPRSGWMKCRNAMWMTSKLDESWLLNVQEKPSQ
jgi:hypothetical protein